MKHTEIERKFLQPDFSIGYLFEGMTPEVVEQGYLSFVPEVRVRRSRSVDGTTCYLTIKSEGNRTRREIEQIISEQSYFDLAKGIKGLTLQKDLYRIPLEDDLIAEVSFFQNREFLGEAQIEVEFSSEQQADNFIPPPWFGSEVTDNPEYKNKNRVLKEFLKREGTSNDTDN